MKARHNMQSIIINDVVEIGRDASYVYMDVELDNGITQIWIDSECRISIDKDKKDRLNVTIEQ